MTDAATILDWIDAMTGIQTLLLVIAMGIGLGLALGAAFAFVGGRE